MGKLLDVKKKINIKDVTWESHDRMWIQDDEDNVWMCQLSPYTRIPIVHVILGDIEENE